MFDAVPISVAFIPEIEAMPITSVCQWCRSINEKHGIGDIVFLAEFSEERMRDTVCSRRFTRCVG